MHKNILAQKGRMRSVGWDAMRISFYLFFFSALLLKKNSLIVKLGDQIWLLKIKEDSMKMSASYER